MTRQQTPEEAFAGEEPKGKSTKGHPKDRLPTPEEKFAAEEAEQKAAQGDGNKAVNETKPPAKPDKGKNTK